SGEETAPPLTDRRTPFEEQLQQIFPTGVPEGVPYQVGEPPSVLSAPDTPTAPPTPKPKRQGPEKKPASKKRAIGVRGVVILRQDGDTVQYRKKCSRCGHEDANRTTRPIRKGITSDHFFCPKCRK